MNEWLSDLKAQNDIYMSKAAEIFEYESTNKKLKQDKSENNTQIA